MRPVKHWPAWMQWAMAWVLLALGLLMLGQCALDLLTGELCRKHPFS